jgi:hypothetical protein
MKVPPRPRKTIVVFYHARQWLPLREANEAHLWSWGRYSKHRVIYVNAGFGVPWHFLRHIDIDAVVFDTIFLSLHWSPEYFRMRTAACAPVGKLSCVKIAMPQDEFIHTDLLVEFFAGVGVTHILTCSEVCDWPKIYGKLDLDRVRLSTVFTGYVDEEKLPDLKTVPLSDRPIALGYRAWNNPFWLGGHGLEKVRIGQIVGEAAKKRGLVTDINNPAATDFLIGQRWYDLLSSCRAVLGVEGGASVLDRDGAIKRRVEAYLSQHPDATFAETRERCFPGEDGRLNLACLSPRHFEACMTRTCQVLLEGRYNGVFEPWKHYIPIKKDYSNVEEALDALEDDATVERIVEQAYSDLVASGKWSYRTFIRDLETSIIDPAPRSSSHGLITNNVFYALLRIRDAILWRFARLEASQLYGVARHFVQRLVRRARFGS